MLSTDLDLLFSGPDAVAVTVGASSFKGIMDRPDALIAESLVISQESILTVKTEDLDDLEEGDEIMVDSAEYIVRAIMKIDDGLISKITLGKE